MLKALIVCSDSRAEKLAKMLEGNFEVYIAQLDTTFQKDYDTEGPHGSWVLRKWGEPDVRSEPNCPDPVDVMFVHTGASDLEGQELVKPRLTFAFSANGVSEFDRAPGLALPIPLEFSYAGESPVSKSDARALAALLNEKGQLHKGDVLSRVGFCSSAIQRSINSERVADPAVELLALEMLRAAPNAYDDVTLLAAAIAAARTEPGTFGMYSDEQLRPKLWHVCKNVLSSFDARRIGEEVVEFALERMERWETLAWGERSVDLVAVTDSLGSGDRRMASERARDAYRRFAAGSLQSNRRPQRIVPEDPTFEPGGRPKHFSILVVDDDEDFLREAVSKLENLANSCRDFEIEILFAVGKNAFVDALAAVDRHTGIQGLVVDWDLTSRGGGQALGTGVDLIGRIRQTLPRSHACLLTGRGALSIAAEIGISDVRPFNKADADCLEHAFAFIVSSIRSREVTPFFAALSEYAGRQISTFHALAISGGRCVRKSPWVDPFYNFYGDRIFLAETSSTQSPLDSLLAPTGTIRDAEARFAEVFGAERVRFVTNGTSTANKIVHQALLAPGDAVLVDRTCHKSHHYAFMLLGVTPVYIQAEPVSFDDEFLGFCAGVRVSAVLEALRRQPRAKMLCLTNCTFDGYVHDTASLIQCVLEELEKMRAGGVEATAPEDFVFFFDEAWFGTARFTRSLRAYSSMEAAKVFPSARIYATQSTHKTMLAFRQGSVILIRDPKFGSVDSNFSEAYFTHTSTSPNYSIIASLDVGRMWADLDGDRICNDAWKLALEIRRQLRVDPLVAEVFTVLGPEDMIAVAGEQSMTLDQTKITLFIRSPKLTGRIVNGRLLAEEDIQFNKYTNNTVLLMVTPGTTESGAAHLLVAIRRLAARIGGQGGQSASARAVLGSEALRAGVNFRASFGLRDAYFGQAPEGLSKFEIKLEILAKLLAEARDSGLAMQGCVSARFVIPYPPGFPLLVPGQYVELAVVEYLLGLDALEIHGMPTRDSLEVWLNSEYVTG